MFLLVSVRHVGAHPDELQHGVSIQSSINLGKTFPRISRIQIIRSTQILARVFVYLPPFISQILDFICRMVLIFILIYFEWRDTENQQYLAVSWVIKEIWYFTPTRPSAQSTSSTCRSPPLETASILKKTNWHNSLYKETITRTEVSFSSVSKLQRLLFPFT